MLCDDVCTEEQEEGGRRRPLGTVVCSHPTQCMETPLLCCSASIITCNCTFAASHEKTSYFGQGGASVRIKLSALNRDDQGCKMWDVSASLIVERQTVV